MCIRDRVGAQSTVCPGVTMHSHSVLTVGSIASNDLKLSVGYGITGNQTGLDPYKTVELYGTDGVYYRCV